MNTIKSQHTIRHGLVVTALTLAAAFAVPAFAASPASSNYGTPVPAGQGGREIGLDSATREVNVQQNETVRFVVGGQSFTWRFDTLGTPVFDLNQVAPDGMLGDATIKVYVAPDPLYIGG